MLSDHHSLRLVLRIAKPTESHIHVETEQFNDNMFRKERKNLKTSWNLMKMLTHHIKIYGTQ